MELKENELKIFYKDKDGIWPGLDDCLENALKEFGYKKWASGMEIKTGVRDLAFEKKE